MNEYAPAIDLRNLMKDYGFARALNDVNLTVYRGEVFGYIGANGAGKTTTIKIMTGLIRPTAGDAMICGHSIAADPLLAKANLGYVPESGALFEKLSPREYLTAMARLYGLDENHYRRSDRTLAGLLRALRPNRSSHRIAFKGK